jgi:predicted RNase H-like nuclease (RuvC/YqgF family)
MSDGQEPEKGDKQEDRVKKLESEARALEAEAKELEREAEGLEAKAEKLEEEAEDLEGDKTIEVVFNEKYSVKIHGKKQTGLSLKETAIREGVPIQLDFVLSIERGGGKTELIGDTDPIKVKEGDRFLAIPNDDNS